MISFVESELQELKVALGLSHASCMISKAFGQISGSYVKMTLRNSFAAELRLSGRRGLHEQIFAYSSSSVAPL
jgi:hypothetical protein